MVASKAGNVDTGLRLCLHLYSTRKSSTYFSLPELGSMATLSWKAVWEREHVSFLVSIVGSGFVSKAAQRGMTVRNQQDLL